LKLAVKGFAATATSFLMSDTLVAKVGLLAVSLQLMNTVDTMPRISSDLEKFIFLRI
jgi:hypothetical protein